MQVSCMINLIGIGVDEGNISFNALKAIKDSDVIIKDVNFKPSAFIFDYIMMKDVIGDDLTDNASKIELAVSASREGKNIAFLSADYSNVQLSNLLIQVSSKFNDVDLKIYPAISSVDFAASLLGAPFDDYAVIKLNNPLSSLTEIESKLKSIAESSLVLALYNPVEIKDDVVDFERFELFKDIFKDIRGDTTLVAVVNRNSDFNIVQLGDLNEDMVQEDSLIVAGNSMTHLTEGYMVTGCEYVLENPFMQSSREFYEKYMNGESPNGIDEACEFFPCHEILEACDYCYCPFYPCADSLTGGVWIKEKGVWSCMNCDWVHRKEVVDFIKPRIDSLLTEVDDVKNKHEELLKIRRECLLNGKLE